MSGFFGAAVFIFLTLAACAPIGGIGGEEEAGAFWIIPKCLEYDMATPFSRDSDLTVFGFRGGEVVKIPVDTVAIGIAEVSSPASIQWISEDDWAAQDGAYWFHDPGRKIIKVKYQSMSDEYTIQVTEPGETPNPGGNTGGGGSGIIIEWGS